MVEEIIVDIDFAGRLVADSMIGGADVQLFAPSWAHSVEEIAPSAQCNGDALGSETMLMILEGSAFVDGPMSIVIGASGGEDVDIIAAGVTSTLLNDLGIKINPGGDATISFQMAGEDGGEAICAAEIIWHDEEPKQRKKWVTREAQNPAVDANVQGANLQGVAQTIAPGNSEEIGGIIGAASSDGGALGGSNVCLIISDGTVDRQEINLGGFGGELITSEGDTMPPTQRKVNYPIKPQAHLMVEFRAVGEDSGTTAAAVSIGLVIPG